MVRVPDVLPYPHVVIAGVKPALAGQAPALAGQARSA
jgi:hypothetical protein